MRHFLLILLGLLFTSGASAQPKSSPDLPALVRRKSQEAILQHLRQSGLVRVTNDNDVYRPGFALHEIWESTQAPGSVPQTSYHEYYTWDTHLGMLKDVTILDPATGDTLTRSSRVKFKYGPQCLDDSVTVSVTYQNGQRIHVATIAQYHTAGRQDSTVYSWYLPQTGARGISEKRLTLYTPDNFILADEHWSLRRLQMGGSFITSDTLKLEDGIRFDFVRDSTGRIASALESRFGIRQPWSSPTLFDYSSYHPFQHWLYEYSPQCATGHSPSTEISIPLPAVSPGPYSDVRYYAYENTALCAPTRQIPTITWEKKGSVGAVEYQRDKTLTYADSIVYTTDRGIDTTNTYPWARTVIRLYEDRTVAYSYNLNGVTGSLYLNSVTEEHFDLNHTWPLPFSRRVFTLTRNAAGVLDTNYQVHNPIYRPYDDLLGRWNTLEVQELITDTLGQLTGRLLIERYTYSDNGLYRLTPTKAARIPGLTVAPNPAHRDGTLSVNVNTAAGQNCQAVLLGLDGRTYRKTPLQPGMNSIPLTDLAPGMYLLKVSQAEASEEIRVVIE